MYNTALILCHYLFDLCRAANSINWGRLLPQIVYHCNAYLDLVQSRNIYMGHPVDICIPTGNFGNALAAYYAQVSSRTTQSSKLQRAVWTRRLCYYFSSSSLKHAEARAHL